MSYLSWYNCKQVDTTQLMFFAKKNRRRLLSSRARRSTWPVSSRSRPSNTSAPPPHASRPWRTTRDRWCHRWCRHWQRPAGQRSGRRGGSGVKMWGQKLRTYDFIDLSEIEKSGLFRNMASVISVMKVGKLGSGVSCFFVWKGDIPCWWQFTRGNHFIVTSGDKFYLFLANRFRGTFLAGLWSIFIGKGLIVLVWSMFHNGGAVYVPKYPLVI